MVKDRDRTWMVNYIPNEVGETYFDIFLADELIAGSPFKVNIFDAQQVRISNLHDVFVGQRVQFEIDVSRAGIGQLEIIIEDGLIPCDAVARGSFLFDVSFQPTQVGPHTIDIKFNGLSIPGTNWFKESQSFNI